jgi:hypothetical protein
MKSIIENLRNKPDHIKSRYVVVLSIVATVVVVGVWIITNALLKTSDDTIKTDGPLKVFSSIFKSSVSATADDYKANRASLDQNMKDAKSSEEIDAEVPEENQPEEAVKNYLDEPQTTPEQQ